jgi:hypothetical protein
MNEFSNQRLIDLFEQRNVSPEERALVLSTWGEVYEESCYCPWHSGEGEKTHAQVVQLIILMELDRDDRLWVVETILGFELFWDGVTNYPGSVPGDPGRSFKDIRLTRWVMSVLIDFYTRDAENAITIHRILGLEDRRDKAAARRNLRAIARAQKASKQLSDCGKPVKAV